MKKLVVLLFFALCISITFAQQSSLTEVMKFPIGYFFGGIVFEDKSESQYGIEPELQIYADGFVIRSGFRDTHLLIKNGVVIEEISFHGFFSPIVEDKIYILPLIPWENVYTTGIDWSSYKQIQYRNYLFWNTNDTGEYSLRAIKLPLEKGMKYEFLNDSQVRTLLAPGSTWPHPGLALDSKSRLILNGQLLTRDWETFLKWVLEKDGTMKRSGKAANLGISDKDGIGLLEKDKPFDPLRMKGWNLTFRGRDAYGNWYWDRLVFSPDGTLIENLQPYLEHLPNRGYQDRLAAMVHPNGDFYFLFFDKGVITLYKIENTWSPEAKNAYQEGLKKGLYKMPKATTTAYRVPYGTVLDDGVRVRWNPNTDPRTGVNTSLKKGTTVQILARTAFKETIDGREAYWYAIKTPEGIYGWSFGGYIKVSDPDKVMVGRGYFGPYEEPHYFQ